MNYRITIRTYMRVFSTLVLLLSFALLTQTATAQDDAAVESASTSWLQLVDDGDYTGSLEASGELMRSNVSAEQWQQALQGVGQQLVALAGEPIDLTQRQMIEVANVDNLPNLPEGEYRVVRYRTSQAGHDFAEIVTLQRESDEWKVVGYYVAPEAVEN